MEDKEVGKLWAEQTNVNSLPGRIIADLIRKLVDERIRFYVEQDYWRNRETSKVLLLAQALVDFDIDRESYGK